MRALRLLLVAFLLLAPAAAHAQAYAQVEQALFQTFGARVDGRGAISSQVLTYSGGKWIPATPGASSFGSQTANYVLAAPNGSDGNPSFRALVAADVPSLAASKITSGQLATARGGTGIDASGVTNGQLLIGNSTGNVLALATLTGTANQVVVTNGASSITLSTPQSIGTGSSPTFAGLTLSSALTPANGGSGLSSTPTDGQLLIGKTSTSDYALAALTGTSNQVVVTNGSGTITLSTPQSIGTGSSPTFAGLTLSSPLTAANGGTGLSSYAVGDLLYASGSTTIAKLADVAVGQVLVSGGVTSAPAYSANPQVTSVTFGGTTVKETSGSGTPEGAVTGAVGSTFRRTDGGSGTSFYVKESGSGNTGWTALGAAPSTPSLSSVLAAGTSTGANDIVWNSTQLAKWSTDTALTRTSAGLFKVTDASTTNYAIVGNGGTRLQAAGVRGWSSTTDATAASDTSLSRAAAGVIGVTSTFRTGSGTVSAPAYAFTSATGTGMWLGSNNADPVWSRSGTEVLRYGVSAGGSPQPGIHVGMGGTSPNVSGNAIGPGAASAGNILSLFSNYGVTTPTFNLCNSRGSVASPTIMSAGDTIFQLRFLYYTNDYNAAAVIQGTVDSTPSSGADCPGMLEFQTSPDGSSTPVTRFLCNSAGKTVWGSALPIGWASATTPTVATLDTALSRDAAGVIDFGTGAQGSTAGSWKATSGTLSASLLTASNGTVDLGAASNGWKRIYFDYTNSATIGAVTINKAVGRCNVASGASSVTVTNSLVTAASHVFCVVSQNDATATVKNVVPASGSFTITITAAATADTSVDFLVINAD